MAQPEYVPISDRDRVRVREGLPVPGRWSPDRVGEVRGEGAPPSGAGFGVAGPDQGYALKLAHRLKPRLVLRPREAVEDVAAGCLGVALKRAALYGRAPVIGDVELAYGLWGFLDDAPDELVDFRRPLFVGAAHSYQDQRELAGRASPEVLRLAPGEVRARVLGGGWRALLGVDGTPSA
jgi:hypothetical protein